MTSRNSRPVAEVVDREWTWSPAQAVALVIGVASLVFGAVSLSQTGFDADHSS